MNGLRETLHLFLLLFFLLSLPAELLGAADQEPPDHREGAPDEHVVAVLSPTDGPLREVGGLHDESVRRVFDLEEEHSVVIGGHTVRLIFRGTGDPVSDSTACVEEAKRVVESEGALAILGPVSSGCSSQVLELGLQVPVISSLSTAASVGDGDEWFFRTIAHDHRRLETFVDTARGRGIAVQRSIAIYEDSKYGQGLLEHLRSLIEVNSDHSFLWDSVYADSGHEVVVRESFRDEIADHLGREGHEALENVFVLASSSTMVDHMQALDAMFGSLGDPDARPDVVLVGSTEPVSALPPDSWLISEAQVGTSRNLVTELSDPSLPENLYISSLDAAFALRSVLEDVLGREGSGSLDVAELRNEIRRTLVRRTFASSERYRTFRFVDGETTPPPEVPIYRVSVYETRRVERVNPEVPQSWVEVRVRDQPTGHLEGPVVVDVVPHGEDLVGKRVTLQVEGLGPEPLAVREVELSGRDTTLSFTPSFFPDAWFPPSFWVATDRTPIQERAQVERLGWPLTYLVALLAALGGALLYNTHSGRQEGLQPAEGGARRVRGAWSYLERCASGILIAFLIIHVAPAWQGEPLLSQIPIPRFGASRWFNAFLSGLLGGWLGLAPIVGFATTIIAALTPMFRPDA